MLLNQAVWHTIWSSAINSNKWEKEVDGDDHIFFTEKLNKSEILLQFSQRIQGKKKVIFPCEISKE